MTRPRISASPGFPTSYRKSSEANQSDPVKLASGRFSDEQLYALALYLYSLNAHTNPNKSDPFAARGRKIFEREGCGQCHTPSAYTNNMLTLAAGFTPPADHFGKYEILKMSVGTNPNLALTTRRGTGYYKVPSLRGLWYRGPLEHSGSVATLEDWLIPPVSKTTTSLPVLRATE